MIEINPFGVDTKQNHHLDDQKIDPKIDPKLLLITFLPR